MDVLLYIEITWQFAVEIFAFINGLIMIRKSHGNVITVFFTFAFFSLILSNMYWIVHSLLRPDMRIPFAANVIGEYAFFLLLASMLTSIFKGNQIKAIPEMIFTAVFVAANAALWIAWSGAWADDILTGLTFGYLSCIIIRSIKQSEVFSKAEWILLGVVCVVLVALQASIFIVPQGMKKPLDNCCYILMFAVIILFFIKIIYTFRHETDPDKLISISASGLAWTIISMYMSSDPIYLYVTMIMALMALFVALSVRKKVHTL